MSTPGDKSRDLDDLVAAIRAGVARRARSPINVPPGPPLRWPRLSPPTEPRSAAERWAGYILRISEADRDIKTVEGLATWLGISASRFNEACWLLGIPPHEARDLARLLRVVIRSAGRPLDVQALLEVSERRTLEKRLDRAGIRAATTSGTVSVEDFLRCQRFVPEDAGLKALRALIVSDPPERVGYPEIAPARRRSAPYVGEDRRYTGSRNGGNPIRANEACTNSRKYGQALNTPLSLANAAS